jgi:ComF family protein
MLQPSIAYKKSIIYQKSLAYLNNLIPSSCLLCDTGVRGLKPLCAACETGLPWNVNACLRCAMPLTSSGHVCGECLQAPPLFQQAFCAFRYEEPVAGLLNRYKHNGKLRCGYWLARSTADSVREHYRGQGITMPACIMPVPLHWRRVQTRGFDQGLEIAKVLSQRLALPLQSTLKRSRATKSQQGLSRIERQHNLEGAFRLVKPPGFQSVALVDDVLTTGSTATEITHCLLQAGVQEVHVWAIARTP